MIVLGPLGESASSANPIALQGSSSTGAPEHGLSDPFMDSLADHAALGDDAYVKAALRRPAEYLRDPADLAEVAKAERAIRGEGRDALAERSGVTVGCVRAIELGRPLTSPSDVRRVLRALDVEPTALPPMVLS